MSGDHNQYQKPDGKCRRCGEVNPAEIHTCSPQEPVAWFMEGTFEDGTPSFTQVCETDLEFYVPLYTAPPQREWQGLTDEEMEEAMKYWSDPCRSAYGGAEAADDEYVNMIGTWRYIEAKLKEKNT